MDRQKIVLILAAAWISAGALTWFLYVSTRAPKAERMVAIEAAAHDMAAGALLKDADLKTIQVLEKDAPASAILDKKLAIDHPLLYPVSANEPLTTGKVSQLKGVEGLAALIEPGMRAMSVSIGDTSGVSGLIQPRSHVDVLFTRSGSLAEALTTTIIEDVPVLAMGRSTEAASATQTAAAAAAQTTQRTANQTATLLVTPEQMEKIELARNLGRISLVLRNPMDHDAVARDTATVSRNLYSGLVPKEPPVKVVEKPAPAPKLEPPPEKAKPKKTVELFRGSEHTQRSFQ